MTLASQDRASWIARQILPFEPALRSWLRRKAIANIEIDDIIQESYAVLAGLDRVDHIRNAKSYLFEVAKSIIRQELRRSSVVRLRDIVELDPSNLAETSPCPESVAVARDELRRTEAIIKTLPAKCREAFTLRKLQGFSQRETAQLMAISEKTVEKHIGKALLTLMTTIGRGKNINRDTLEEIDADLEIEPRRLAGNQRGH